MFPFLKRIFNYKKKNLKMTYNLNQFDASEKVSDGKFTGLLGVCDPSTRGLIFENDELVSVSFGYSPSISLLHNNSIKEIHECPEEITNCFEGPLVKVWWDSKGEVHLSTTNKLNCTNSYWGDKEERFGPLFYKNGGTKFLENVEPSDLTHHFMIVTNSLMVTSDLDLKDNNCIVVYLGSVSKQSEYISLKLNTDVFCHQIFDIIPEKKELEGRILVPYVWKIDEDSFEFIKRNIHFSNDLELQLGEETDDELMRGVDLKMIQSYLGRPVIVRGKSEIVKVIPYSYNKRCGIIGNSPNIKLLVFNMMEKCKPRASSINDYFDNYDFLFVPTKDFVQHLVTTSENVKKDIIREYRARGSSGFTEAKKTENNEARERNMLLILLLCLPQCKSKILLNAFIEYSDSKLQIRNYIAKNLNSIIDGFQDERLVDARMISRVKDIAYHAKEYATKHKPFSKNLNHSLTGLINNERGASLYRIHKVLRKDT